jgi:L-ascorbate metabolism protein UlaG (beta-lactamase superfamily)
VDAIAERHPDIDLALVHLGGPDAVAPSAWTPRKGVDFLRPIDPGAAVPVHYDDYRVFRFPLSAFVDQAARSGPPSAVKRVRRGETITLGSGLHRDGSPCYA